MGPPSTGPEQAEIVEELHSRLFLRLLLRNLPLLPFLVSIPSMMPLIALAALRGILPFVSDPLSYCSAVLSR